MADARFPTDTFPRQQARTRRYTLGRPRTFTVAEDGSRVAFLRSRASDDPVGCLWVFDVASRTERLVFDPSGTGDEHLSAEERDRRERRRESLTGVTDYASDRAGTLAAFAMDGGLLVADLVNGDAAALHVDAEDPFDPRPDPSGRRIAYVADGALRVVDVDGANDRELASDPDPDVSWGLAEFVGRRRDGSSARLLVVPRRPATARPPASTNVLCRSGTSPRRSIHRRRRVRFATRARAPTTPS